MLFQKLSIIGVGLLGGSLGLAVRDRQLAARVEGWVRRRESISECHERNVADLVTTDLKAVVSEAGLLVLCTPVEHMRALLEPVLKFIKPGAIVTDVGSVKSVVVQELETIVAQAGGCFVGSHPMAGGERVGVAWARGDLFAHAVCALTPTAATPAMALERITEFWEEIGMRVLTLAPELHDELVARASHLPHLLACVLAAYVLDPQFPAAQRDLCAGGFRDTTRIASGPVAMWEGIIGANRLNLAKDLAAVEQRLRELRQALERNDRPAIAAALRSAHDRREQWLVGANGKE